MITTDPTFARNFKPYQPAMADALRSFLRRLPPQKPQPEPRLVFDGTTNRPRIEAHRAARDRVPNQ